ncbi:MAG: hypothetical protein HY001_02650 [Candidatus Portnoybacteria bacterium]|nr:hypothetical protein [Candidatus Portnoybacteria bacterium]
MIRLFVCKFPEAFFFLSLFFLGGAFFIDTFWFLVFVGFIPLFYLLDRTTRKVRLAVALIFGAAYAEFLGFPFFSLSTINSIPLSGEIRAWAMGGIFLYLFINGILAGLLLWSAFAFFKRPYLRVCAVVIAWVIFETILIKINNGAQWGMIGESLVPFRLFRIWARAGGVPLLSAIVLLVNITLYEGSKYFFASRKPQFTARVIIAFAPLFLIVISFFGGGVFMLSRDKGGGMTKGPLRIAIVQSNYHGLWSLEYYTNLQDSSRELIERSLPDQVDLLVYPSLYMGFLKKDEITPALLQKAFGDVFLHAQRIIFGFSLVENDGRIYSAEAIADKEGILELRKKEKLFFLSDYTPSFVQKLIPSLRQYALSYSSSALASQRSWFELPQGRVATLICNEGLVPELARRAVDEGGGLVIISGSDADFSNSLIHRETLRMARIRAVENNAYVAQAMKTGISAIIDPQGEVKKFIGKDEQDILVYEIPKVSP